MQHHISITLFPDYGRANPLWVSDLEDNDSILNQLPLSDSTKQRLLVWDGYWQDHYRDSHWAPGSDVEAWLAEGHRLTERLREEIPGAEVDPLFTVDDPSNSD